MFGVTAHAQGLSGGAPDLLFHSPLHLLSQALFLSLAAFCHSSLGMSPHFSLLLQVLSVFCANLFTSFSASVVAFFQCFLEGTDPSLPGSAALLQLAALTVGAVWGPAAIVGGPNGHTVGSDIHTASSEPIGRVCAVSSGAVHCICCVDCIKPSGCLTV